jgi:hypothetical protein
MADELPRVPKLTYAKLRPKIRSGDLWLCKGTAPFSRLIMWSTGQPFSHVAFVMRLEHLDRIIVLESVESVGVRTVPTSRYVGGRDGTDKKYPGRIFLARHKKFPARRSPKLKTLGQFAIDQIGYPYDTQEVARIAWRIATKRTRSKRSKSDRAYTCSEYAQECYQKVGIEFEAGDHGFIAPGDFAFDPGVEVLYELKFRG